MDQISTLSKPCILTNIGENPLDSFWLTRQISSQPTSSLLVHAIHNFSNECCDMFACALFSSRTLGGADAHIRAAEGQRRGRQCISLACWFYCGPNLTLGSTQSQHPLPLGNIIHTVHYSCVPIFACACTSGVVLFGLQSSRHSLC